MWKRLATVLALATLATTGAASTAGANGRERSQRSGMNQVRQVTRPARAASGFKRYSMGSGMSGMLGGARRTGVTYYGGGNYAVNWSDGSVGSMAGTHPSSEAPVQQRQTDTSNAGSTGSGGFETEGHVVATGQ